MIHLFEFNRSAQSGWLFEVDRAVVSCSCGSYQVKNGDVVEWLYTENMGRNRGVTEK
ncbi:DUF4430 domain-containing protein [Lentilactobacillus senioris]|uniref:DUF4430 domain-containing protein n=1 Tax=Lentilactobacillus senioris TaxID=931534 RepID=UPI003D278F88